MEVCATMIANDPVYYPTDPHPVRPGTSDALTARTIDATIHPPIVRAQEAVAEAIPRLAVTMSSPLFLTTLGLTLVLVLMAMRLRSRMLGLVLSALLVMTLTSFSPVRIPDQSENNDDAGVQENQRTERWERPDYSTPAPDPTPYVLRIPTRPHDPMPDLGEIRMDEEELRAAIEELRDRIESELRRRARDQRYHHYEYRSTRWLRKLPRPVREWAQAGQQTIVAWARDP
jgi:hypothetical protein